MVTVIKSGHSIHRIFNYNENKVKVGMAECIGVGNYPVDHDKMSLTMKMNRLLKQLELNENVTRNSVHISLNFHPSESHFSKEKLMAIVETYMDKIGFGKQPYLVYQHHDAGHPHIHLVTTNIEADGKRIDLHHLGIRKSEPARKIIEKEFGLINAESQRKQEQYLLKPVSLAKVLYGKSQTKMAIQNVLESVLSQYRYTNLPELNAVLKQYNVMAERGGENSRVYQHNGLLYRILDADGNPIGVPIKASTFYNQPTLKFLEEKFKENESKRMPHKARIKNAIDMILTREKVTLHKLIKALEKQGIHVAQRKSNTGLIYGITYVDHQTKCVFNGSALGKQYSAKAIQERCQQKAVPEQKLPSYSAQEPIGLQLQANAAEAETKAHPNAMQIAAPFKEIENLLDNLMQAEQTSNYLPYQLKRKRKKRRRKNLNNNQ
ncbi:conjugative transposon mobilization protein BF0132 [Aquipluma nitroreducens]|uniref:Conjugative transposon mobilization protein BF0132 n=1 Tax=Aquipluma nitroreducens TaxID=2010828 RepID=A0A5K7S3K2_9BACT|nr:relaxase/mobilization nuclease domain-containing protein [Aquipluma nitroreducens]BBE16055.1 conjugative transposon mobilization protein BF0132 [Aquipluma nitroreducens]